MAKQALHCERTSSTNHCDPKFSWFVWILSSRKALGDVVDSVLRAYQFGGSGCTFRRDSLFSILKFCLERKHGRLSYLLAKAFLFKLCLGWSCSRLCIHEMKPNNYPKVCGFRMWRAENHLFAFCDGDGCWFRWSTSTTTGIELFEWNHEQCRWMNHWTSNTQGRWDLFDQEWSFKSLVVMKTMSDSDPNFQHLTRNTWH